jgi:ABC-type lipoprotein release transport system permease subunit
MRIAWRNLLRNRWRSGLTAGGVAVAVAVIIWMSHMMSAFMSEMIQGATRAELGDFQIHSADYVEEQNLFNAFSADAVSLEELRAQEGIRALAPRVHAWGLIGYEKTSQSARLLGIDPKHESQVTATSDAVIAGQWLSEERPEGPTEVVLGKTLAELLEVQIGDELVVMLQAADGSLGNDSLRVVGLVETRNSAIDRHTAFLRIGDLQWITALDGRFHEIAGAVKARRSLDELVSSLQAKFDSEEPRLVARTWGQIVPDLKSMSELSERSMWVFYGIIYLVAGLGLFNTQRMTAYERRREFGVLLAIGTRPLRLLGQVLLESALLTAIGGVLGAGLGLLVSWWHSVAGFSLGDEGFDYMGVAFSELLFFEFDFALAALPLVLIVVIGALCSCWPAAKAARINIPSAISGRQ